MSESHSRCSSAELAEVGMLPLRPPYPYRSGPSILTVGGKPGTLFEGRINSAAELRCACPSDNRTTWTSNPATGRLPWMLRCLQFHFGFAAIPKVATNSFWRNPTSSLVWKTISPMKPKGNRAFEKICQDRFLFDPWTK